MNGQWDNNGSVELDRLSVLSRSLWTFVWFAMASVGTNSFGSWASWTGFNVIGPLLTLVGVAGIVAVWTVPPSRQVALERTSLVAAIGTVLVANGPVIAASNYFNTDAAAFNQRATELLIRGINPYSVILTPAHLLLRHANNYWTYLMNGGHVDRVSYPAGSFLLQAPLQLLGLHHLGTDWLDLIAWLVAGVILFAVSPAYAKWVAPLLILATELTYTAAHGGTDALFVPFMMLAALRWDDFVTKSGPKWTRWLGPVALGVACSIKQTPWFAVPFFIAGIAMEAGNHDAPILRTTLRYLGLVALPFVALNLPFFIWSPSAWLRGVLLPIAQPLVPDGQGLVSTVTHGLFHSVHPLYLLLAALLAFVSLLAAFIGWYPVFKRAWMFAVPIVLYLPSRSLSSYLVDFIPAAFVMVLTTKGTPAIAVETEHIKLKRAFVFVPAGLVIVCCVLGLSDPALTIQVDHYGSSHYNLYIDQMTLTFTNNTNATVTPHVMIVVGANHPTGFWSLAGGNTLRIPPRSTRTVVMQPPRYMGSPKFRESWLVEAFATSPSSMSTTSAYVWPFGKKQS